MPSKRSWRQNKNMAWCKIRPDVKWILHDVKNTSWSQNVYHDVKKFDMTSKVRYGVKKLVIASKSSSLYQNTSWWQKVPHMTYKSSSGYQKVRHDVNKYVTMSKSPSCSQKYAMTLKSSSRCKNMSWSQSLHKLRHVFKKFVMMSKRSSWCQQVRHDGNKFVITSQSASLRQKVRLDVKNTLWRQKVRHDIKNTPCRQKLREESYATLNSSRTDRHTDTHADSLTDALTDSLNTIVSQLFRNCFMFLKPNLCDSHIINLKWNMSHNLSEGLSIIRPTNIVQRSRRMKSAHPGRHVPAIPYSHRTVQSNYVLGKQAVVFNCLMRMANGAANIE